MPQHRFGCLRPNENCRAAVGGRCELQWAAALAPPGGQCPNCGREVEALRPGLSTTAKHVSCSGHPPLHPAVAGANAAETWRREMGHDSEPLRPGLNTTTYYLLLTTYYLLLTTYYLLLTTYYLLPTTYYLLPNTY